MAKKKEVSLEDVFKGFKSSLSTLYKKKFKLPTMADVSSTIANLNYGLSKTDRAAINQIGSILKRHGKINKNDINFWTLGYISGFTYLTYMKLGKEEKLMSNDAIIIFVYSDVFGITKSEAEKKLIESRENNESCLAGAGCAELDFNECVNFRISMKLNLWQDYINQKKIPKLKKK